jgi:hypothetical protein
MLLRTVSVDLVSSRVRAANLGAVRDDCVEGGDDLEEERNGHRDFNGSHQND